jgi:hypothetical protein
LVVKFSSPIKMLDYSKPITISIGKPLKISVFLIILNYFKNIFKYWSRVKYVRDWWYYNAGSVPAEILKNHTELAHVVKLKLGTHMFIYHLYKDPNSQEWKNLDSIHLLINHRSYLDKESPIKEFNETNIWNYDRAYGRMARTVLKKANVFVPTNNDYLKDL